MNLFFYLDLFYYDISISFSHVIESASQQAVRRTVFLLSKQWAVDAVT